MLDITAVILEEHGELRRRFADLDDAKGEDQLREVWKELADLLEIHASCEEDVFYPHLLKARVADAKDETEDAIHDHDKIRQAIRAAANKTVGSDGWWEAVGKAREENTEHLGEEEDEGLADFRKHASDQLRAELAVEWRKWRREHRPLEGVSRSDTGADAYLEKHGA